MKQRKKAQNPTKFYKQSRKCIKIRRIYYTRHSCNQKQKAHIETYSETYKNSKIILFRNTLTTIACSLRMIPGLEILVLNVVKN